MDQRPESPRTPPPFFNFSPDLKNYRAFLKSPNAVVDSDASKFALSEMDFESAYALLTTTPDFQIPTTPGANQLPPLGQEMDFKETFLPNKPPSPNVLPSVVPNWQFDIGQPSPKYHELLSVNETNALENFLDSIIDVPARNKQNGEAATGNKRLFQTAFPSISEEESLAQQDNVGLELALQQPLETSDDTTNVSSAYTNPYGGEYVETQPSSASETPQPVVKKQRKKRKNLLTEDQKKLHHTTSEKRRRGQIKESFDRLVSLLPLIDSNEKKSKSKSVVLETAGNEIDKLIRINQELKKLLNGSATTS